MRLLQKTLPGFAVNRLRSEAFVLYPQRKSVTIKNNAGNVNLFIIPETMIENTIAESILIQEIFRNFAAQCGMCRYQGVLSPNVVYKFVSCYN